MDRRPLQFSNLQEAVEDAHRLNDDGYHRAGNWSLAENLDHLNKTMRLAIDGPSFMLPAPIRPLLKWYVFGKMKRGEVITARANAPEPVQPANDVEVDAALAEFARLAKLIESDDTQLASMHPVFGKFTREEWKIMQRWHAAHHLSFLLPMGASVGV